MECGGWPLWILCVALDEARVRSEVIQTNPKRRQAAALQGVNGYLSFCGRALARAEAWTAGASATCVLTSFSSSSRTASEGMFSACASKLSSMRCRIAGKYADLTSSKLTL